MMHNKGKNGILPADVRNEESLLHPLELTGRSCLLPYMSVSNPAPAQ